MAYDIDQGITQTMLSNFCDCERRSKYILDGWERRAPESDAMRFGTFVHEILDRIRREPVDDVSPLIAGLADRAITSASGREHAEKIETDFAKASAILPSYVAHYPDDWKPGAWVAVEEVFDTMFSGIRIRGKVDGVRSWSGRRLLLETKTKGQVVDDDIERALTFDFQSLFYLVALRLDDRFEGIHGLLYDVIRNPSLRRKKDEELHEFEERIRMDVQHRPEHYFRRFEVVYSEKQIAEFKAELRAKIRRFTEAMGAGRWLRNERSCVTRFKCSFMDACSARSMIGYSQDRELFRELH